MHSATSRSPLHTRDCFPRGKGEGGGRQEQLLMAYAEGRFVGCLVTPSFLPNNTFFPSRTPPDEVHATFFQKVPDFYFNKNGKKRLNGSKV